MPARGKTHDEFVAEMQRIAPQIEVVGRYGAARTKVACRCRTCGHEWEALPNHLLRGSGCPRCAGTMRSRPEDFAGRVACRHASVELLSDYVNARTRVRCRCLVCGHEWEPYPKGLLQGNGCPACARRASTQRLADLNAARGNGGQ